MEKKNWKESLEEVRQYVKQTEPVVEQTEEQVSEDELINQQIEEELNSLIEEDEEIVLGEEGMGDKIGKLFKTKDKKEIDGIANLLNMTSPKVLQSMQKQNPKGFSRMAKKLGELPAMEEVEESVERTTEKLVERNMLGRLSKSLGLTSQGKKLLFDYFDKGELKQ